MAHLSNPPLLFLFRALTLSSPEVRFHMDSETHDPIDLQTKELRFAGFDGHWIRLGFRCAIWFVSKQNIIPKVSMSRAVISVIFFFTYKLFRKVSHCSVFPT